MRWKCLPSSSHKHCNQPRIITAKLVLTHDEDATRAPAAGGFDPVCVCHIIRLLVSGGSVPGAGAALCGGHGESAGSSSGAQHCGGMRQPQAPQLPVSLAHAVQRERYRWTENLSFGFFKPTFKDSMSQSQIHNYDFFISRCLFSHNYTFLSHDFHLIFRLFKLIIFTIIILTFYLIMT